MKPDTASRLLYQEAALRSFLRSDNIAQSFIQNTPNYNMDDLQQLYFASASIKSKKMLIEFVKISTKQLCISLRDKLPIFRYLNPDNISTDLTDDELMLLIHEASHSMNLDQQISNHGNIAFLVAKNIIFNLVGVNATATLNSFLKTPDLGSFASRNKTFEPTEPFSTPRTSSSAFPMPPPPTSSPFSMHQTATSSLLTPASSPPPSAYMPSFGSSPTIISTSIANLSFVTMNSSMPQDSNSFMTISTSAPHTMIHSVAQSNPTPAITEKPHNTSEPDVEPDFDTRSNASGSSETRFEIIGDSDDDNSRNDFNHIPTADYAGKRVDSVYEDDDRMEIESDHDDNESEKSENDVEKADDEPEKLDNNNDDDDSNNTIDNYQVMDNNETTYDDLYEQEKSFEQEMLQDDEIKRVFSISKTDDQSKNDPSIEENNNTPPSTPPPIPFLNEPESPRRFPLRKRPRKRKASRHADDNEEVVNKHEKIQNRPWLQSETDFKLRNKSEEIGNRPWLEPETDFKSRNPNDEVDNRPWLEPDIDDFKPSNEPRVNSSVDVVDGRKITNINQVIERSQPEDKKLFADESMYDLMNDLKQKGVLNIPSSPRNITFSNIDA